MHLRGDGPDFSAASSPSSEGKDDDGTFFSPSKDVSDVARDDDGMRFSPDVNEGEGGYRIVTVCFGEHSNEVTPSGVCPVYKTGSPHLTFAIVKPAIDNTRVDMSPYGQSVFVDAVGAIQEFVSALRTDVQAKALKTALQMLGDLTGFGISYFDFDGEGYV